MPRQYRRYDKREKMTVVMAAEMSNAAAAAEAHGVPESTLSRWLNDPELVEMRAKTRESLAEDMKVLAVMALRALVEAIQAGKVMPRDLVMALGVAVDKAQLLSGQATGRIETKDITETLDDHERAALRDVLESVLREAEEPAPAVVGVAEA